MGLGIAAAVLGSSIARPLDRLARTAHALGSGDFAGRAGLARRDELGAVARAFDEMADRLLALMRAQTTREMNDDTARDGSESVGRARAGPFRPRLWLTRGETFCDSQTDSQNLAASGTARLTARLAPGGRA